ncbi:MAG: DUF1295 domain-containing protein [Myxococcota bacterium]
MMDLYAHKGPAVAQKLVITGLELALIGVAAWLLFGSGEALVSGWLGIEPAAAPPARRAVILAFDLVVLARMAFMMFYLMRRTIPWSEALTVPLAFALYYVGFALFVLPERAPLGWLDAVGIALFVAGSSINTVSELQRHRFKQDPAHRGQLYTGGLFAWSMHVNCRTPGFARANANSHHHGACSHDGSAMRPRALAG